MLPIILLRVLDLHNFVPDPSFSVNARWREPDWGIMLIHICFLVPVSVKIKNNLEFII